MSRLPRPIHWLAAVLAPVLLAPVMLAPVMLFADGASARAADDDLVARGEYVAIAGDCVACHTAPGGKPMAGGLEMVSPLGTIVATNITPSKDHGIGRYSFAQFDRAVRRGVRADGARLYPAMPYTAYAKLTGEDMRALYAYFMRGVAPVEASPPRTRLPFPFNIRLSMAGWNWLFLDTQPFRPDAARSAEWNRGAYLVQGAAHCGACHTPRNFLMAEKSGRALAGEALGGWYAPNITADRVSGIGGWSVEEIATYLRTGRAHGKAQAGGPMAEAVDASFRHMTGPDLRAIAVYLKSSAPVRDPAESRPAYAWGKPGDDLASIRGVPLPDNLDEMTGPQLYDAHCATCHQAHGEGSFDGGLPALFHNAALGRSRPDNLVMVILHGLRRHPDVNMPGFARDLTDIQIARLVNYMRVQWGNPAGEITARDVAVLRDSGPGGPLLLLARSGMLVLGLLIVVAGVLLWRRRRQQRQGLRA